MMRAVHTCSSGAELIDYGLASAGKHQGGSFVYARTEPPELAVSWEGEADYTQKGDVFAFGLLLWEALSGEVRHTSLPT